VRIYLFRPDATLHAKALLIDDDLSIVGSANLDDRSFRINFESGALICDGAFTTSLERCFLAEMANSREVTLEEVRRRTLGARTLGALARLAAPLF
jgi:cardiolipin synthase